MAYMKSQGFRNFNRQMHKAICSDCGQETEVPFKPIEGKPVYCRTCYQNHKKN
ncbi:MAG: CxxC-x17-CxxC domain-containing protein [Candidatus Woesearchaeota archaeon]